MVKQRTGVPGPTPRPGVQVQVTLTRRQATAVLRASLSVGHGVRQSADLLEAQQRIQDACRKALEDKEGGRT